MREGTGRPGPRAGKLPFLLGLLAFFVLWAFVSSGGGGSGLMWRFREIRRAALELFQGKYSAPDSTGQLAIALGIGAVFIGWGTFALARRLRGGKAAAGAGMARGCAGLLAGAVLFTFVAPFALIGLPPLALGVGAAFALRMLTLLPRPGRAERSRKVLVAGVAVYWFLFYAYEAAMAAWSATVSGAIRADIVVFYPLLFAVTAAGVWLSFDRWSQEAEPRPLGDDPRGRSRKSQSTA